MKKELLIIIHGSKETAARYKDFEKYLNTNGVETHTGDLASHGSKFTGECHNFTFDEMLQSALDIIDAGVKKYPDHTVSIFGHSMGSFITKYIVYTNLRKFDRVILSGTNNTPKFLTGTMKMLTSIGKKDKVSNFKEFLSYGGLELNSKIKGYGGNWLSVNEDNEAAFEADPLCGNPFSNQALKAMFEFIAVSGNKKTLKNYENKEIPQLLIYGEQDPVCNFGKDIKSLVKKQKKLGMTNSTVKSYPESKHEILLDNCKDTVSKDILDFIKGN